MKFSDTQNDYNSLAKWLHWLIAAIFICQIPVGWYMTGLSDEDVMYWRLLDLHVVVGLSLFVLVPIKLGWRWKHPNPEPLSELFAWERNAARTVHAILLVAMIVLPVTGFIFIDSNGEALNLYNVVKIPSLGHFSKLTRNVLSGIHVYLAYTCAVLIVVHILAALKHHFLDKNKSLRRMGF